MKNKKPQIHISLSREHKKNQTDVADIFNDFDVSFDNGLMRFSEGELAMAVIISLGGWVASNVAWDLLKYAVQKLYKKFPHTQITIRDDKAVMYTVRPDLTVGVVVPPDRTKEFEHIKVFADLVAHFQNSRGKNSPVGWERKKLSEVGRALIGLTYSPADVVSEGGVLVLRSSNIKNGKIDYGDQVRVSAQISEKNFVKEGDILICARNGSRGLIGKNAYISKADEGNAFGAFMSVFRSKNPRYVYQLFQSTLYKREIERDLGPTINQVTTGNLSAFKFDFPPVPEQDRIVTVLETWDKAIIRLTKKLEIKKKLKTALTQKLLSGDVRLPGFAEEWKTHPLSFYVQCCPRPVAKPTGRFTAIGIRSHCKGTFRKENFDPASIDMDTLYELRENDLVVNITFAWEGAVAIVNKENSDGLVSHRFPTYTFKDKIGTPEYFRQYIQSKNFRYQLKIISPGGAGRNRVLSKKDFVKIKIKVPDFKEQCAIGKILNTADKEIMELQSKLTLLTNQKHYLLNNLVTGAVRTPEALSAAK